jgi:hypothetical protein
MAGPCEVTSRGRGSSRFNTEAHLLAIVSAAAAGGR